MPQKLRQRKKTKLKGTSGMDQREAKDANSKAKAKEQAQKELQRTLLLYALLGIALYFLRSYAHHVILKRPHVINSIFPNLLRPAVDFGDERQVLIVGTMSSGTSQVAVDLTKKLGLEIGHELTDALDKYIRDGTSSWFHGIRFFDTENKDKIIHELCYNFTEKMGFHPRQYHHVPGCSEKKPWYPLSECWLKDCIDILEKEWGCAASGCTDTQPFRRTLLQVRDPRATVESLLAKFCQEEGSLRPSVNGTMQADWIKFHNILFQGRGHDFEQYNCIEAISHNVLEYNNIMLKAKEKGWISDMYKVETTTPCEIVKMAGFRDYRSAVYKPNYYKLKSRCTSDSVGAKPLGTNTNRINKGRIRLDWSDYEGGKHGSSRPEGDKSLEVAMRNLMESLGYNPDEERLQQQPMDDVNEEVY